MCIRDSIKVPGSPEELAAGERQPADTVRADSVPDPVSYTHLLCVDFNFLAFYRDDAFNQRLIDILPMAYGDNIARLGLIKQAGYNYLCLLYTSGRPR